VAVAAFAAIDLGAETGRVLRGTVGDGGFAVDEVRRFPNNPVRLPDGLHWDLGHLLVEALGGIRAAGTAGPLQSVGVDAWGVDYALLGEDGALLGLPFHYRDERISGMMERAAVRLPPADLYATTGIQRMPINTCFQLLADEGGPLLGSARRIALVPDLFAHWLSGRLVNEVTAASTTGLLDARSGRWAHDAIARLSLPTGLFEDGLLTEPGVRLGSLLGHHADALGLSDEVGVVTVAGHDTASAFAAAPIRSRREAVLSSGTWSLLGLELDAPILGEGAMAANLTNERGLDGTTRLLKNVMGLWLLQECRREWGRHGLTLSYQELLGLAAVEPDEPALFDPDDPSLLAPGGMPERIAEACLRTGQRAPRSPGAVARSVLFSLACKYRLVLESLERVSGREIESIRVIGGGARNHLLCRLTAAISERQVHAGPVEATALGNILAQARAVGLVSSLEEGRELVAPKTAALTFEPDSAVGADASTYERFRQRTAEPAGAEAPV
jgi:rhamnulokinase